MNATERSRLVDGYLAELRAEQAGETGRTTERLGGVLGGTGLVCPQCGGLVATRMAYPAGADGKERTDLPLVEVARSCLECPWERRLP